MLYIILKCALVITILSCICCQSLQTTNNWHLTSPDGSVSLTIELGDHGEKADYPTGKERLYYKIEYGQGKQRTVVLQFSPMGIIRKDLAFVDDLIFDSKSNLSTIDEIYTLVHGKRSRCHSFAREMSLTFINAKGAKIQLILRAYNDGIAFRYHFPERDNFKVTVTDELTGFRLPADGLAYMQPYDEAGQWTPAYEAFYQKDINVGTPSIYEAGWCFPALFRLGGGSHWLLLTEAGLDGSYHGSRLAEEAPFGVYRIRMPDAHEGNGTGAVQPSHTLPWSTPWRVVVVGNSLKTIVESSLVTHLSAPSAVKDTEWIKPGRVSWSWWSEQDSPKNFERLCEFIDLAANMGWEYSLVDANWNEMGEAGISELAKYAAKKGVGLLFWYNSGGKHNIVTEAPRDRMSDKSIRQREFRSLRNLGVKGVKVDFFQSDKQNIIQHYLNILRDAADYQMMVNFHGCTLPRGWTRTYPHLMTMEAVKGAECYIFNKDYPAFAPWHNTILAFTRNVVGPMDYTPVTFSDNKHAHITTNAHELALSVVFESGWLHFADRVSAYENLPAVPKNFLRKVPTAWDDIHFISGEPGKLAIIARRKGKEWYVGGINGESNARNEKISLDFLAGGSYAMTLIRDGGDDRTFSDETSTVSARDVLEIKLRPHGGFVIHLEPVQK